MKKLKNLLSFMLIAVFAFTGTLMLSGCKKVEQPNNELTKEQKIQVVKTVINDTITKVESALSFEEGYHVQPKLSVQNSVFTRFGDVVIDGATDFETFTSRYIDITNNNHESEIEMIMGASFYILAVVEMEDFEFNTKLRYALPEDEYGEIVDLKLNFDENSFVLGLYEDDEVFGFYKFNYLNNSIVSVETCEGDTAEIFTISTDSSKRMLDNYIYVKKQTTEVGGHNVSGYFCEIYSEAEGKCFTEAWDMIVENPENIINFIVGSETYGEMVDACKEIIDANQALLESLN